MSVQSSESPPEGGYSVWQMEYYQQFFKVDTEEVVWRCLRSMWPFKVDFIDFVSTNPDFYGPLWVRMSFMTVCNSILDHDHVDFHVGCVRQLLHLPQRPCRMALRFPEAHRRHGNHLRIFFRYSCALLALFQMGRLGYFAHRIVMHLRLFVLHLHPHFSPYLFSLDLLTSTDSLCGAFYRSRMDSNIDWSCTLHSVPHCELVESAQVQTCACHSYARSHGLFALSDWCHVHAILLPV